MSKALKILLILVLFGVLACIRMFESILFYDPLIAFFKTDHSTQGLPEVNTFRLLTNVAFRFMLNTGISLLILWVAFRKVGTLKVSAFLYGVSFVILLLFFWYLLGTSEAGNNMLLFYVRRFLIQPLFLLILLPAFYFQKEK
ncbi:exosortase F system-associated membrane protein [Patiriisocius hiemis]|uniref:Exosortase F system-associated protein n=1 Tax=Patiriisocius hiemis TaxID=3075604 RepID=A0ABU2YEN7_9FLAO|nr:exosortase F system-associated protein [Constantimarinum sp. W242]MDT0556245.1 exosortase F system-associated protein [Constantimarinum sp. W242]